MNPRPDARIAAVLEHEAEIALTAHRFDAALVVLGRVLQTDWATPNAFLFKAIALRNTTTGPEGTAKALALLDDAGRASDGPDPRIDAERVLLHLRENRYSEARRHRNHCLDCIDEIRAGSTRPDEVAYKQLHEGAVAMSRRLAE